MIRMTSPGPIIFKQRRAGKHGKPFVMYKFRSMSNDAEMRRAELEPFNQMSGPVFKVDADPRITPFGRWLRRTSIDELPQLVNVLLGDMSLVGPRPLPLYEVEKFENTAQRRRLSVKPGLTCLWQISGRNQVKDFKDWVKLDLDYIDRWSLSPGFQNSPPDRAGRAPGLRRQVGPMSRIDNYGSLLGSGGGIVRPEPAALDVLGQDIELEVDQLRRLRSSLQVGRLQGVGNDPDGEIVGGAFRPRLG